MKAIIMDIDGTIANLDHRLHYVQDGNRDWGSFFREMGDDLPVEEVISLAYMFKKAGYEIVVVSARPDDYLDTTKIWMANNGMYWDSLYMRKAGDFREDSIVKREILAKLRSDGYEPWLVIDDRQKVVDMWRSEGIYTLQAQVLGGVKERSKYAGKELLHMMVGPSGAGKSTYIAKNYRPQDVISSDQVREDLFGSYTDPDVHTPEKMKLTWNYIHALIKARIDNGLFTVLDATNVYRKDRLSVVDLVPDDVLIGYVMIDRRFEDKMASRGWRPEWLVQKHHNAYKSNIKDILKADDRGNIIVYDKREFKN